MSKKSGLALLEVLYFCLEIFNESFNNHHEIQLRIFSWLSFRHTMSNTHSITSAHFPPLSSILLPYYNPAILPPCFHDRYFLPLSFTFSLTLTHIFTLPPFFSPFRHCLQYSSQKGVMHITLPAFSIQLLWRMQVRQRKDYHDYYIRYNLKYFSPKAIF